MSSPMDFGFVAASSEEDHRGPESQRMLADPFVGKTPPPPPVPPLAPAALAAAVLAALPVFSFASIFVGIRGLTQTKLGTLRGRTLAIAAIVAGSVFSVGYSATAAIVTYKLVDDSKRADARETKKWQRKQRDRDADRAKDPKVETPPPIASGSASNTPSTPSNPNNPNGVVPEKTTESRAGSIRVVEIGFGESSLKEALIREQATAKKDNKQILVMTTRGGCQPCASVIASLPDSRMQEALAQFQLVRVDVEVFKEELIKLHYDASTLAGFFLLTLARDGSTDGTPRDGINSGEWGADVAENVAPVLRSFVRGEYKNRKNPFRLRPNGTFL